MPKARATGNGYWDSAFAFTESSFLPVLPPSRATPAIIVLAVACSSGNPTGDSPASDPCGHAAGNGAQVIAGPSAPGGSDLDRPFQSLHVSSSDASHVYVGTERNGIVRSTDGGATWERLRSGLRHSSTNYPEIYDLAMAPGNNDVVFAATADSPGPPTGDAPSSIAGVYRSRNGGATWARVNCGLPSSHVTAVVALDAAGTVAVVGVTAGTATFSPLIGTFFRGGLFRTTDGGARWAPVQSTASLTNSRFSHIQQVMATGELLTYARNDVNPTRSVGFLRSTDQGVTWIPLADPLGGRSVTHFAVSSDGSFIWANTADTFRVWRSTDRGVSWSETGGFIANGPLAASPSTSALLLDDFGTLRVSTDGLATHRTVVTSPQPFEDIVFAPSDANVVYAVTRGYDVYRSRDAGQSFQLMVNLRASVLR